MNKNSPPQTFPVMAGATEPVRASGGNVQPVYPRRAARLDALKIASLFLSVPVLIGAFMCLVPLLTNGQSLLSGNLVLGCILGSLGLGLLLTAAVSRILR